MPSITAAKSCHKQGVCTEGHNPLFIFLVGFKHVLASLHNSVHIFWLVLVFHQLLTTFLSHIGCNLVIVHTDRTCAVFFWAFARMFFFTFIV